jgi:hypothetical protein
MTRSEQEMYRNIERIAVALETLVIETKNQKIDTFRKATGILYGNGTGRSHKNYEYGNRQDFFDRSELQQRVFEQSQTVKGGDFPAWYDALTLDEREAYGQVRDQLSR